MGQPRSPRTEAIAFRIWQHCEPRGWDMTIKEAATAIGVDYHSVRGVVNNRGWGSRFRVGYVLHQDPNQYGYRGAGKGFLHAMDEELEALS